MSAALAHAERMNSVYRCQRHIYDLSRKYYLFGRDRLIDSLDLAGDGRGSAVLEIACGTGRNLAMVRRKSPAAQLFGVDISTEMLKSARTKLGPSVSLAAADATDFDPQATFGRGDFDRIVMSYCISMIPVWREALAHACGMLSSNGSLHIVDFGDMQGLPATARRMLRGWLARFHVTPRHDLQSAVREIAGARQLDWSARTGLFGYFETVEIRRTGKQGSA